MKIILNIKKLCYFIFACSFLSLGSSCSSDEVITQQDEIIKTLKDDASRKASSKAKNSIIHKVTAGGNDACEALGSEPGCDGNYSLVAQMREDGSVKGQWQDTFSGGGNGIHVNIDCMYVDGNMAIVGGTVTKGSGSYEVGDYVITKVVDNGTSNNDIPDQISLSYDVTANGLPCDAYANANFTLLDLTRGQVKVW